MFYTFRQNNSFGRHDVDLKAGIALYVIVEAENADDANDRAQQIGVYFDGCERERDCPCCGDRWHPASDDDAANVPSVYGAPITDPPAFHSMSWTHPEGFVHYADGRVEAFDRFEEEASV